MPHFGNRKQSKTFFIGNYHERIGQRNDCLIILSQFKKRLADRVDTGIGSSFISSQISYTDLMGTQTDKTFVIFQQSGIRDSTI